jgi:serine phosphatase RsbU (regulator of sigma subunit)/lipopolysaccharide biosynthesis regulator YciM
MRIFFLLLMVLPWTVFGQTPKIDSINRVLQNKNLNDTAQVLALIELATLYRDVKPDTAIFVAKNALQIAEKKQFLQGIAASYNTIGRLLRQRGEYDQALEYGFRALKMYDDIDNKKDKSLTYNNIGIVYYDIRQYDKARKYLKLSLELREKIGDKIGIATSYNNLGRLDIEEQNYERAMNYFKKAVSMTDSFKEISVLSLYRCNMAEASIKLFNHKDALIFGQQSLELASKAKNKRVIARSNMVIGATYLLMNEPAKAIEFLEKGIEVAQKFKFAEERIFGQENLHKAYGKVGRFEDAYQLMTTYEVAKDSLTGMKNYKASLLRENEYNESQRAAERERDNMRLKFLIGGILLMLGLLFAAYRAFRIKAKSYQIISLQTLEIQEKNAALRDSYDNVHQLNEIGKHITASLDLDTVLETVYQHVNELMDATVFGIGIYNAEQQHIEYRLAIDNGLRYKPYVREMSDKNQFPVWCIEHRKDVFINDIANEYSKYIDHLDMEGDVSQLEDGSLSGIALALIYVPMMVKDNVLGIISVQSYKKHVYKDFQLSLLESIANYAAIALENSLAYQQIDSQKTEIKDKNDELNQMNEELYQQQEELLMLNESIAKQKEVVEDTYSQLKHTTDELNKSIRYASHIQEIMLPNEQEMRSYFADLFILYMPRDLVSGDFYWFSKINECTGHGVPGSFMSMLGSTLLHQIINVNKVISPAEILQEQHIGIQHILKQKEGRNADGMDLSVCYFEKKPERKQIHLCFAGAKTSMYYVSEGVLQQISGDRQLIGGKDQLQNRFNNHPFDLNEDTFFYLFSDGYIDQNDKERQRFGQKRFKEMIVQQQHLPFSDQKEDLKNALLSYKQMEPQRDDISVVGLRVC